MLSVGDRVRYIGKNTNLHGRVGKIAMPRTDLPPGRAWGIFFEMDEGAREYAFASSKSLVLVESAPDFCAGVVLELAAGAQAS